MSIYKKIETKNGFRYFKDKRFIKAEDIPAEIFSRLELNKDLPDVTETLNPNARMCIFCGMGSKIPRLIDGKTVYVCEQHYHEKNTGQLAQRIRELEAVV